jgi:hypothetical protein
MLSMGLTSTARRYNAAVRTRITALTWLLVAVAAGACGVVPKVTYRLPGIFTAPLGWQATDGSVEFGDVFCATLTHLDPQHADWGPCQKYLDARVSEQPAPSTDISTDWHVLIVGGLFSHCFEDKHVYAFEQARAHLEAAHHLSTVLLPVGSTDTPEQNAAIIAQYLTGHPGKYIAVGHSKGAVDLMVALQNYEVARTNIHALVSVAGAISGSRLVDFGIGTTIIGFQQAVRDSGLGNCRIEEHGGIASTSRRARNEFLRQWTPPQTLRSYSLAGVVDRSHVSKPLRTMWNLQSLYSLDQDSQMVVEEAIIPGARFLGVANGDHWALALPFSENPDPRVRAKVNHNAFPRVALLEAIVRYADLRAKN